MSVVLSYLHSPTVSHTFMSSVLSTMEYDSRNGNLLKGRLPVPASPMELDSKRNMASQIFLDTTDSDWLWMVDTDMGFSPDTLYRLMGEADPTNRPVVGALCYAQIVGGDDNLGDSSPSKFPTLYDWGLHDKTSGVEGFARPEGPIELSGEMEQVAGTGAACLLIHRNALLSVRDIYGDAWFTPVFQTDGVRISEDLSFCYKLNIAGLPVFVHTGVVTTHHKSIWI